jgi:hypothetical protein
MPQWLRSSLIARLSGQREAAVRAALEALLLTALEGRVARTDGGFALEVATRHRRALHRLLADGVAAVDTTCGGCGCRQSSAGLRLSRFHGGPEAAVDGGAAAAAGAAVA